MRVICYTCECNFITQEAWDQHRSSTNHRRSHTCESCGYMFEDQREWKDHVLEEHGYTFQCKTCNESFIDSIALEQHAAARHIYSCKYCVGGMGKIFNTAAQLQNHLDTMHNFVCEYCGKKDIYKKRHEKHRQQHIDHKELTTEQLFAQLFPLKCDLCSIRCANSSDLQSHVVSKHSLQCSKCDLSFETQSLLEAHNVSEHRPVPKIPCTYCVMKFGDKNALETHMSTFHSYKCANCAMVFREKASLQLHENKDHRFKCVKCTKIFDTVTSRSEHFWAAHSFKCCGLAFDTGDVMAEHKEAMHYSSCQTCLGIFDSLEDFASHRDNHHTHICSRCEAKFSKMSDLLDHHGAEHATTQSQGLECPKCFALVNSSKGLLQHDLRMHRVSCEDCDAMFERRLDLDNHRFSQHGMRCPKCDMRCTDIATFIDHHNKTHMTKCSQCAGSFTTQVDLVSHMSTVHLPEKVFACMVCDESFATSTAAKEHYSSQHAFECDSCPGATFVTASARDEHAAQAHPTVTGSDTTFESTRDFFSPVKGRKKQYPLINLDGEVQQAAMSPFNQLMLQVLEEASAPKPHCDECAVSFYDEEEFRVHMKYSPFHGMPELKCLECNLAYTNQIALLEHWESKPHGVKWVVSVIKI